MTKDPLRALEAVYSFVPQEEAWLAGIVEALRPYDLGDGIAAYTSVLGDTIALRAIVNETRLPSTTVHQMVAALPAAFYRRLHAPMPLVSSSEQFPKLASEAGIPAEALLSELAPTDAWAFAGGDADVETALVVFHCAANVRPLAVDKHMLDCVAAHVGSALRLRSRIGGPLSGDGGAVEAVFARDGRLLDARAELKDLEARAPLIAAVQRLDASRRRSATDEERIEIWTALVEGQWSIVESTESDGKRMLLACRNDPRTRAMRALGPRERAVASYAALGHSYKYIAYELGIAVPTAAAALKSALRKLGLRSRVELIELYAHTGESTGPAGPTGPTTSS